MNANLISCQIEERVSVVAFLISHPFIQWFKQEETRYIIYYFIYITKSRVSWLKNDFSSVKITIIWTELNFRRTCKFDVISVQFSFSHSAATFEGVSFLSVAIMSKSLTIAIWSCQIDIKLNIKSYLIMIFLKVGNTDLNWVVIGILQLLRQHMDVFGYWAQGRKVIDN